MPAPDEPNTMPRPLREWLYDLATIAVVICALVVTAAVIRREYAPSVASASPKQVRDAARFRVGTMLGSAQAPDTIIEFSDYECPSCAAAQSTLREFEQRHPGRVVVVFRHFPLSSIHPRAAEAAGAAVCAEEQGRFREMSELLFESQQSLGAVPWKDLALRSGVPSLVDFQACMGSQRPLQRVAVDVEAGHQIGVEGTPSFLIGDRLYAGRLALAELEAALNE